MRIICPPFSWFRKSKQRSESGSYHIPSYHPSETSLTRMPRPSEDSLDGFIHQGTLPVIPDPNDKVLKRKYETIRLNSTKAHAELEAIDQGKLSGRALGEHQKKLTRQANRIKASNQILSLMDDRKFGEFNRDVDPGSHPQPVVKTTEAKQNPKRGNILRRIIFNR